MKIFIVLLALIIIFFLIILILFDSLISDDLQLDIEIQEKIWENYEKDKRIHF